MMSSKLAILGLLKVNVFWNEGYDFIISVHDVTNKISSRDSNYIVDVVMWSKFGNFNISIREININSILYGFDKEKHFFWGVVLVKVQLFGTGNGNGLEILRRCGKRVKTKLRKFWWLIPAFVKVTGGKTGRGPFCSPLPSWIGLKLCTV